MVKLVFSEIVSASTALGIPFDFTVELQSPVWLLHIELLPVNLDWVPGRPMSCAYRHAEYLRGKGGEGEIEAAAVDSSGSYQ